MNQAVLIALIGGGTAAVVSGIFSVVMFLLTRHADRQDKREEKVDKTEELAKQVEALKKQQEEMEKQLGALQEAQKCILLDRIIWLGQSYIRAGEIDFDDRRRLRMMHNSYHNGLHGNGDADAIMKAIDSLPLKNSNRKELTA